MGLVLHSLPWLLKTISKHIPLLVLNAHLVFQRANFLIYIYFFSLKDKEKVKSTCALTKNRSGCICPCLTVRLSTDPLIMEFSEPAWRTLEALEYMDLSGLTITIKIPYSCSHLYIAKDVLTLPVHWALARFQKSQPVQIITGKNPYKTKTARLIIERWIHFLLF